MEEEHIFVLNVKMNNYSKKEKKLNSKLVCITGFMGSGKSTAIQLLSEQGFEVFEMDKYIHSIYSRNKIGYEIIKKNFGSDFVTSTEVNRLKLRELIIKDKIAKKKLDSLMLEVMINKIKELYSLDRFIVVELGIYIYNQIEFYYLFKKIIAIYSCRENINDNFNKFHQGYNFSTKDVENSKMLENTHIVYVDYIVENNVNLESFFSSIKNIFKILT